MNQTRIQTRTIPSRLLHRVNHFTLIELLIVIAIIAILAGMQGKSDQLCEHAKTVEPVFFQLRGEQSGLSAVGPERRLSGSGNPVEHAAGQFRTAAVQTQT